MTFMPIEQSNHSGQPVILLRFQHGFSVWTYASAPAADGGAWTYDGEDYAPIAMDVEALAQGGREAPEQALSVPTDLPVVDLFRGSPPSLRVTMTMRRIHVGDVDGEAPVLWVGPIVTVSNMRDGSTKIVSRMRGLKRGGLRCTWGRGCQHVVYGPGCGAIKATMAVARTVTAISGNEITLDTVSPSEGYFDGGIVEWDADGLGTLESRTIEREVSSGVYRLFGRADWFTVGMAVTLYPGCDYTAETCDTRFAALADYDGIDFMPGKSPFDGTALI